MERRQFTREFKLEAVRLMANEKRPAAQVARELGIGANLLRYVLHRVGADAGAAGRRRRDPPRSRARGRIAAHIHRLGSAGGEPDLHRGQLAPDPGSLGRARPHGRGNAPSSSPPSSSWPSRWCSSSTPTTIPRRSTAGSGSRPRARRNRSPLNRGLQFAPEILVRYTSGHPRWTRPGADGDACVCRGGESTSSHHPEELSELVRGRALPRSAFRR